MLKKIFIFSTILFFIALIVFALKIAFFTPKNYTVISSYPYQKVVWQSEKDIEQLITLLKPYQNKPNSLNQRVALATHYFLDRPYRALGVEGEGDWCPGYVTRHGCPHIKQDPVYRTDAFVCNTFVQIVLASLYAHQIQEFHQNILKIKYGAAHEPSSSIHYYNRNHFISADFNPVNEKNGFIQDATKQGIFGTYVNQTSAMIDRQKWFDRQMQPNRLKTTVRVLFAKDGLDMAERAARSYPAPLHYFSPEKVTIDYIPKEALVQKMRAVKKPVAYRPHTKRINQLPSPAIVEIVRDVHRWKIAGKNIAEVIGSEINISHLGLIYRQYFKSGEIIYQRIECKIADKKKICTVTPVICRQYGGCTKLMFAHATEAYPNAYFYYRDNSGQYHCEEKTPPAGVAAVKCNRVVSMPLEDYLTTYRYGVYPYLDDPSILGIHVEKLLDR